MNKEDEIVIEACVDSILKLIKQGRASFDTKERGCMYREDGTPNCPVRCAVGHMIKDEYYDPHLENQPVDNKQVGDLVAKSLGISELSEEQETVLRCLQMAHDDTYLTPESFQEDLLKGFKDYQKDSSDGMTKEVFKRLAKHGVY